MALARRKEIVVEDQEYQRLVRLYNPIAEQEQIYRDIYGLAPTTDEVPPHYMFPGRCEHTRHYRREHTPKHRTGISHKDKSINKRSHRPWRPLTDCWPEHRRVVEVQIRGGIAGTGRVPNCYHVDRKWFNAETGKALNHTVERWRMMAI